MWFYQYMWLKSKQKKQQQKTVSVFGILIKYCFSVNFKPKLISKVSTLQRPVIPKTPDFKVRTLLSVNYYYLTGKTNLFVFFSKANGGHIGTFWEMFKKPFRSTNMKCPLILFYPLKSSLRNLRTVLFLSLGSIPRTLLLNIGLSIWVTCAAHSRRHGEENLIIEWLCEVMDEFQGLRVT